MNIQYATSIAAVIENPIATPKHPPNPAAIKEKIQSNRILKFCNF